MQDFKKLRVWQKSHDLTLKIYRETVGFPDTERFGLVKQLRKSVVSIESNLAEGSSRRGDLEFRRFLYMAMGSASEAECQLLISRDLGYMAPAVCQRLTSGIEEIRRMLWTLIERVSVTVDRIVSRLDAVDRLSGADSRKQEAGSWKRS